MPNNRMSPQARSPPLGFEQFSLRFPSRFYSFQIICRNRFIWFSRSCGTTFHNRTLPISPPHPADSNPFVRFESTGPFQIRGYQCL